MRLADETGRMRHRHSYGAAHRRRPRGRNLLPENFNLGGLSKARRVRDYLVDNRIAVVSEDSWGGEITTAAVAHFAASTPEDWLVNTTDLMNYNTRSTGIGGPTSAGGKLYPGDAPGLGVEPDFDSLGTAVRVYS